MKLIPYRKALEMGKEKIEAALASAKANKAKKQAELEIMNIEERIAAKEIDLQRACSRSDLDFGSVIELQDDIVILERKRKQFMQIIAEMFPAKAKKS